MINKIYEKIKKYLKENYKFLISLILILFICFYKLPFVINKPGGIIPVASRIQLENKCKEEGSISMSYVSMIRANIPFTLLSFIIPNWDLEKEEEITLENESIDDSIKRDKISLKNGLDNAIISTYRLLDKEVNIKKEDLVIMYITKEAETNLKIGDVILKVDDINPSSLEELQKYINSKQKGETVNFSILRNDKNISATAKIYEIDNSLKVGVSIEKSLEYETNPRVKIKSGKNESGSSGGLMTALEIYNSLTEEDITKGRKIVGTGSIDINGNVLEIGGVKYKLLGASKNKADIFLCPEENYAEARKIKEENNLKITLKSVKNLKEAVDFLKSE